MLRPRRPVALCVGVALMTLSTPAFAGAPYCPNGHSQAECDMVWAQSQAVANHRSIGPTDRTQFTRLAVRARRVLDSQLNDYPSARFRTVMGFMTVGQNGARNYFLCGEVNAKNLHGAYTGWSGFAVADMDGGAQVFLEGEGLKSILYTQVCGQTDHGTLDTVDYAAQVRPGTAKR